MRRNLLVILPLGVIFTACSPDTLATPSAGDSDGEPGVAPMTTGFPDRALEETDEGFRGMNLAWREGLEVSSAGARIVGPSGELGVRFAAWGREGSLAEVPDVAPTALVAGDAGTEIAAVALDRPDAREWWASTSAGLEQGWDLRAKPAGDGPLVLALDVSGATPSLFGGEVRLTGEAGEWRYAGLVATDAEGVALPAWFEVDGDRVLVRVDDAQATWPIRVDPVMTTAVVTWSGAASALLAQATVGDFNKDGYGDVALGAPGAGAVYVYTTHDSNHLPTTTADVTLTAPAGAGSFGSSIDTGDVNGDTYADLVVGAYTSTTTGSSDGAVYVYYGSSAGLGTTATKLTGSTSASAYFGYAVATGDPNGDGYDDVVVGEPGSTSGAGIVWVFKGASTGVSTSSPRQLTSTGTGSGLGTAVSSGGSTNSDAYEEVGAGAPTYGSGSAAGTTGKAVVWTGASTFFTTAPSATTYNSSSGFRFGSAITIERSLNNDTHADMVISAPTGPGSGVGRLYYYQGASTGHPAGNTRTFDGTTAGSYFGASLFEVPDTDDDGFAELVVGAPSASTNTGFVALYDGSTGTGTTSGTAGGPSASTLANTITGSASGDYLGSALGGGDVNGDGNGDILIGAYGVSSSAGQVTLRLGGTDGDSDGYVTNGGGYLEDCNDGSSAISPAATEICDAGNTDEDCDGLSDDNDSSAAAAGKTTYYRDVDGDGYGDASVTTTACDVPTGYVSNSTDCNDADDTIHPGATEVCDASDTDEDCDGLSDDADGDADAGGKTTYYADGDGDGYGGTAGAYCDLPAGYLTTSTDCDDTDAAIHPGATEVCDAADVDEDCDGLADDADASATGQGTYYTDVDGDGYAGSTTVLYCDAPVTASTHWDDCDDTNAAIHPGAAEVCDAGDVDEDCDGLSDDADSSTDSAGKGTYYLDSDADGYGSSSATLACDQPAGAVTDSSDCNDADAAIHPGATEVCDAGNTDEDCDGSADDDDSSVASAGKTRFYADADDDSYGGTSSARWCDIPIGYVTTSTDCDDGNDTVHPGATEICDSANTDEDCDGVSDDLDASVATAGKSTYYADSDSDGYGGSTAGSYCDLPSGYVASSTDCDDTAAVVHPGATEVCDAANTDEDCDGMADDDDSSVAAAGKSTYYADSDSDGYGGTTTGSYCDLPSGYVATSTDCNDASASIHPGATEVCDAANTDEDCDGLSDDLDASVAAAGKSTYYADSDSDGYGGATPHAYCDLPSSGYVATSTDCDDSSATVHPGATEVCDAGNTDEDCDGLSDDLDSSVAAAGKSTYYADSDSDGYGGTTTGSYCDLPGGYVATSTDCDDASASIHPGATEVCDAANTDEDCDGLSDDLDSSVAAAGKSTYYADSDSDGYGGATPHAYCDLPSSGYVATSTDCDDSAATVHPGATEVCDAGNTDEDCDGLSDDLDSSVAAAGKSTYYVDSDSDGYGGATTGSYCDRPSGYVATSTDCDDASASIHPGATEICDAADTDEDCDGLSDDADSSVAAAGKSTYYADSDSDGYGGPTTGSYCDLPSGYVATSTDCNDSSAAIHPGATEVCDSGNTDEDCDGLADDNDSSVTASGKSTYYADSDSDGYGGPTTGSYCDLPSGYVATSTDCNDSSASIHPGATEVCDASNTDEDCDGLSDDNDSSVASSGLRTWYVDADRDGYGGSTTAGACDQPTGYVATSTDCDDASASIHPGATELCDAANTDEDCDGVADDADASASVASMSTWYADIDGDGYGSTATTAACDEPSGYVATSSDCDDAVAAIHPGATEVCDAADADEDCDGLADDADTGVDASTQSTGYLDSDGDGYGDDTLTVAACTLPASYVVYGSDCDDTDGAFHPGATETCTDPSDYNCDGSVAYADLDGDSFAACEECDDADATINPDADELCDLVDNNCDGTIDEPTATDAGAWYADVDGDGFGDASGTTASCEQPVGYVADNTDCDDSSTDWHPGAAEDCAVAEDRNCDGTLTYADDDGDGFAACLECDDADAGVNPDAYEQCDGVDNNCDGDTDEDSAIDAATWYADVDTDGYGTSATATVSCEAPAGYVATSDDCDDGSVLWHPGASEVCTDPNDYNCDGSSGYVDADSDGWAACAECDDTHAGVRPDAAETCNGIDDNCDGTVDEDSAIDAGIWFLDADGDGYGDDGVSVTACSAPAGYVALSGDCNDSSAAYNPAAAEDCADPTDYNCDGSVGYTDGDGDGWAACEECDDADGAVHPGASEVCDGVDNDCEGTVDEGATDATAWYGDADADGYGDVTAVVYACDMPADAVADGSDCNDVDAAFHPGATESCTDTVDFNCDGSIAYADDDGDGYAACEECDDADAAVNPGMSEVCNGVDDNCDGVTDDDAVDASPWYEDLDGDGYGDEGHVVDACTAPVGYTGLTGDCDVNDAAFHPGAAEDCADPTDYNCDGSVGYADADADGWAACQECDDAVFGVNPDADEVCDGVDNDCDGGIDVGAIDATTWYADADADGYGDLETVLLACEQPAGFTDDDADCNDNDLDVNPAADEVCDDTVDNDCDNTVDAADADCTGDTGVVDTGDSGDSADTSDEVPDTDSGPVPGPGDGGGCNCSTGGDAGVAGGLLLLAALAAGRRRR